MLSACVAAVKCRHVLHHFVVIFFSGPKGSLNVCLFAFKKWNSAHELEGVSGVASFITTDEQLQ